MCYWKKLLKEARIDWTNLSEVTSDRKVWKSKVMARIEKLDICQKCKGHKWTGAMVEQRNEGRSTMAMGGYVCKVCRKVCKLKGGLKVHRRRMHEVLA